MNPSSSLGAQIVTHVRQYIGTPFHLHQRVPFVGIDCAGIVFLAAKKLEDLWTFTDTRQYTNQAYKRHVYWHLRARLDEIAIADAEAGDVLLFWLRRPHVPQHMAIKTGPTTMIHSSESGGVCEVDSSRRWDSKIFTAFRFRITPDPQHQVPINDYAKDDDDINGNSSTRGGGLRRRVASGVPTVGDENRGGSGLGSRRAVGERDIQGTAGRSPPIQGQPKRG